MDSTKPANRPIRPFVKKSMARRSSDVALFRADANPSDVSISDIFLCDFQQ